VEVIAVRYNRRHHAIRVFDKIQTVEPGTIVENSGWELRWLWSKRSSLPVDRTVGVTILRGNGRRTI
jgi:hypothetical protein